MIYTDIASDDHCVLAKKNLEPQMKAISKGGGGTQEDWRSERETALCEAEKWP